MQQRVALARALVNRPDVLLLDEPLGALDLKLRRQMQIELKRIQQEVGLTFIHVTHDQEEAMTMADTIAVMNAGRIEQLGDPATLYEQPRSTFVANFLGQSNLLRGHGQSRRHRAVVTVRAHDTDLEVSRRAPARRGAATSGSGCAPRSCGSASPAGPTSLRGVVARRVLHRRRHAVHRGDALGPGAHRRAAERRLARGPASARTSRVSWAGRARLRARRVAGRRRRGRAGGRPWLRPPSLSTRARAARASPAAAQLGALRPAAAGPALARRLLRRCRW